MIYTSSSYLRTYSDTDIDLNLNQILNYKERLSKKAVTCNNLWFYKGGVQKTAHSFFYYRDKSNCVMINGDIERLDKLYSSSEIDQVIEKLRRVKESAE